MIDALAIGLAGIVVGGLLVAITWATFAVVGRVRRTLERRRGIGEPPTTET